MNITVLEYRIEDSKTFQKNISKLLRDHATEPIEDVVLSSVEINLTTQRGHYSMCVTLEIDGKEVILESVTTDSEKYDYYKSGTRNQAFSHFLKRMFFRVLEDNLEVIEEL